ncbi:MAG: ATPase [Magnetococcales bacterium]|nr:ATPase [Magnetococcales bacterium]
MFPTLAPPRPAYWFRLLVARSDLPAAIRALAALRVVELETTPLAARPTLSPTLAEGLARYRQFSERYRAFWPEPSPHAPRDFCQPEPENRLAAILEALEQWRLQADPLIEQWRSLSALRWELSLYSELLESLGGGSLDLPRLRDAPGMALQTALLAQPADQPSPPEGEGRLMRRISGPHHHFLVVVGTPEAIAALEEEMNSGRRLIIPSWLTQAGDAQLPRLKAEGIHCRGELGRVEAELNILAQRCGLAERIRVAARLQWFYDTVREAPASDSLAWITGWTAAPTPEALEEPLAQAGVRGIVAFAPGGALPNPPMIQNNPRWAVPFELFPRLLGTPGRFEADPSPLLAGLVPLLFGYMFGDVGQGAVLAAVGWMMRRRFAQAWLLVAGGISAMGFGWLFGSVFCLEDWIPALWTHPLSHPLMILGVPLGLGAGVIGGGMALAGLQAAWRGAWPRWVAHEGGWAVIYVGLLMAFHAPLRPLAAVLATAGVAALMFGHARHEGLKGVLVALGHLPETLLQLAVNTLSFSRVGAFALAHAGLAQAVVALAQLAGEGVGYGLTLVIGNLLILLLEGLVVGVQTTRLVLFEFFIRFLRGEGRSFRPLTAPPF